LFFLSLLVSRIAGQTYCNSGPTSSADTNIGAVTLIGDNSRIDDTSNCPKTLGPQDLTRLVADLTPGGVYTLSYEVTACGYYYTAIAAAWIDYNHNGVFDTNENLFFNRHFGGSSESVNFLVPSEVAFVGTTRMRVQIQETDIMVINPCANFTYGATKDFSITLKANNPYCKAGPTSSEDTQLGPALLEGERNSIIQNAPVCPGYIGNANFTDVVLDLLVGRTYPYAFSVVTCRKQYPIQAAAWVDWNQNHIWEDPLERILQPTTRYGAIVGTFTVPADAKTGPTSMRTMVQESPSGGGTIQPCDMFQYGGTYDYPLHVNAA